MPSRLMVLLFAVANISGTLSAQVTESGDPIRTITMEELREHIELLAADSFEGRYVGSRGYELAARYAGGQLHSAGLTPFNSQRSGVDAFLQSVPFREVLDGGTMYVRTPVGELQLRADEDFKYLVCRPDDLPDEPLPVVFTGYGIEEPAAGWNDYAGLDVEGTAAIMLPGSPMRDGLPVLPTELHRLYAGGEGDGRRFWALRSRGPRVLILGANQWRTANWDGLHNDCIRFRFRYDGDGRGREMSGSDNRGFTNQIVIKQDALYRMFAGQDYSPARTRAEGIAGYRTFQLRETSVEFDFRFSEEIHESWNVVGMVQGTDPALREEYIVVGAHLDHIRPTRGQVNNGADDNASGSAGVMEVAEAVALTPLLRSVIFVLYTAEELGLLGSEHFLTHAPVPVERIIANINLDMIGRTAQENAGNRAHYVVSQAGEADPLSRLIREVNERTVQWPLVFRSQEGLPGGSDHLSFAARGIPAVFLFSGHHADLHRPTDDAELIEYDKVQRLTQLVYATVMELGNRRGQ